MTVLKSPELAHDVQDDAFHEIQLNGKQLVFLFMVATVVSVVVFLCGVFVGRGVRAERAATVAEVSAVTSVTTPDVVAPQEAAPAPAGSDPSAAAPPPAVDELSYFNRLGKEGQPEENLRAAVEKPAGRPTAAAPNEKPGREAAPATQDVPVARATRAPGPSAPAPNATGRSHQPAVNAASADPAFAEPAATGFTLQITALKERGEAESVARRWSAKGYAAYVVAPAAGSPSVYRVRIGKYKTRREAEAIAAKLQKEEQLKPWITR